MFSGWEPEKKMLPSTTIKVLIWLKIHSELLVICILSDWLRLAIVSLAELSIISEPVRNFNMKIAGQKKNTEIKNTASDSNYRDM